MVSLFEDYCVGKSRSITERDRSYPLHCLSSFCLDGFHTPIELSCTLSKWCNLNSEVHHWEWCQDWVEVSINELACFRHLVDQEYCNCQIIPSFRHNLLRFICFIRLILDGTILFLSSICLLKWLVPDWKAHIRQVFRLSWRYIDKNIWSFLNILSWFLCSINGVWTSPEYRSSPNFNVSFNCIVPNYSTDGFPCLRLSLHGAWWIISIWVQCTKVWTGTGTGLNLRRRGLECW